MMEKKPPGLKMRTEITILLEETTITSVVGGGDTITFKGLSGIERIMKIDDGLNGTKPMIKSKKGEDSDTVVATIVENTVKGEIDKYDIKFKPENGGKPVIVDPRIEGNGKK